MIRRLTKQRQTILHILRGTKKHPTADVIYDEVRKLFPNISKGTVYRNLKILREQGDIAELKLSGHASRYDGRPERHYHFRCEHCGQVFDLEKPVDTALDGRIAGETGFQVWYHRLEFRGLCNECQAQQA
jgi:Fe2+ or Zn2+ uptake regulation protein